MPTARIVSGFTVALMTLLGTAGCSGSAAPALRAADGEKSPSWDNVAGGFAVHVARGKHIAEEVAIWVCAATGPVRITSVTLDNASPGFELRAWGVSNPVGGLGDADDLTDLGDYHSHVVTERCDHGRDFASIGVLLVRTAVGSVKADGFDVHYVDKSVRRTLWLGYTAKLTA